jgi:hypothetical protein
MSCPPCTEPFIVLSSRIVNSRLLDIRGFFHGGILDIELVHHPDVHLERDSAGLSDDDVLLTIEEFRAGVMGRLGDTEMAWLRTPFSGVYSLEVRHKGKPILFWLGKA